MRSQESTDAWNALAPERLRGQKQIMSPMSTFQRGGSFLRSGKAAVLCLCLAGDFLRAGEWRTSGDARLTEHSGVLAIASKGKDPWIATREILAGARGPFELRLRIAGNADGNGAVYHLAEPDQDFSASRVVSFPVTHDGQARDLRVKLPCPTLHGQVQRHVHDFHLPAYKAANGETLLHDRAYPTLNESPRP